MGILGSFVITVEELLKSEKIIINKKIMGKDVEIKLPENREYVIPGYQREIRWKPKNVRVLFDNIEESSKFLGSILICQKENENQLEIIDGQQRITVLTLFIKALAEQGKCKSPKLCAYRNETIKSFDKLLEYGFDETIILSEEQKAELIKDDLLDQRYSLKEIWKTLKTCISEIPDSKHNTLIRKILTCQVNVIMCIEDGGYAADSIFVDYYLDLNDKAVELDSIDILKAELFRKDFSSMTQKWINIQRAIKEWSVDGTKYPIKTFYYHLFVCVINKYLGYQLTSLSPELKITKDLGKGINKISSGTHVVEAVANASFCTDIMSMIEKCVKCFGEISSSKGNVTQTFLDCFNGSNDPVVYSAFHIMNTILKIDNEVPKMLIMKYYLDVMCNSNSKKSDYKLIYYIYLISILFVTTSEKKSSAEFVPILLSENWKERLKECAKQKYKDIVKIRYMKPTKSNNQITKISGQYLPKNIFAIRQYILTQPGNEDEIYIPNEGKFKEYLEDRTISAEHFFINESFEFKFTFGNNQTASIKCPANLKKIISFPINYLYIKKDENSALGDGTIIEKIRKLEIKDKSVFANELVYQFYQKAREVFLNGDYPTDLDQITSINEAKKKVRDYYKYHFQKELERYTEEINSIVLTYSKEEKPPIWKVK